MRRIGFVVHGRVQGVGFRAATRSAGERCGVTGHVRNRADGLVEGEAQGAADAVERFVEFLATGPVFARVDRVDITDLATDDGEAAFVVRR